jgi:hypothetical protein
MEKPLTEGEMVAISFKPFINPKCTEHDEIVKDFAKSIDGAIRRSLQSNQCEDCIKATNLKTRVKQLLSSLNYESLNDFQAKCVLLLERELKD